MSSRYEELLQALLNGETANIVPRSRVEAALKNCIEGCGCDGLTEPKSRAEAYLQALAEKMKGGGGTGGGTLPTGSVELIDQDYCGPYNVTYKTYENGNVVDKTVVLPAGGVEEVGGVIQGTVIEVSGGASLTGVSLFDDKIGDITVAVSENGIAYSVFPNSVVFGMLTIMG